MSLSPSPEPGALRTPATLKLVGLFVVVVLAWALARVALGAAHVPAGDVERPLAADARAGSSRLGLRASHPRNAPPPAPAHVSPAGDRWAPRAPGEVAPSLEGTAIDGAFELDAEGHVLFSASLVQLFDYLRATKGEVPDEAIRAYLEALAAGALPPFEVARVLEAYDRYLRHIDAVQAALAAPGEADDGPEAALDRVHAMRVGAFGATDAERAFGADERLARAILERQRIAENPTLTAEARDVRLSALEATLPEEVAARWSRARALTNLRDRTLALRAGGSDAESDARIEALRVETVGREAAARLAELDEARAGWAARVEAYHADLRARSGDRGALSEAEVASIARAHFEGPELVRIAALERIEGRAAAARE